MKKNENDGSAPVGFTTLSDTPGIGDVTMPTAASPGSGDVFGGIVGFGSWKKRNRRTKKKSRKP